MKTDYNNDHYEAGYNAGISAAYENKVPTFKVERDGWNGWIGSVQVRDANGEYIPCVKWQEKYAAGYIEGYNSVQRHN